MSGFFIITKLLFNIFFLSPSQEKMVGLIVIITIEANI